MTARSAAALARRSARSASSSGTGTLRQDAGPADHARHRQAHLADPVERRAHAHRQDRALVARDGLGDVGRRQPDGEVRVALAPDDPGRGVADLLTQVVALGGVDPSALRADDVHDRGAADRRRRPQHRLGVAVLADDDRVDAGHAHAEALGEHVAQPGRVEHGAAADHPAVRQARQLLGHVRHDVDRVGDEQVDGVGRDGEQRLAAPGGRGRRWRRPGPGGSNPGRASHRP